MFRTRHAAAMLVAVAACSGNAQACSTCGCSLNSDWSTQGYARGSGLRLDLRYDYFDQDQLRSGTSAADRGQYPVGPAQGLEIQQKTLNRVVNFAMDYSPGGDWGVSLLVPYVDRYHSTILPGDADVTESRRSGVGDTRVIGRYQGFSKERSFGVLFGVKLPTGEIHQNFDNGPGAGTPLDRGLQLGTGTTDLLLGFYKFGSATQDWDYFLQALALEPMNSKEDFRPSDSLNVNFGFRYMGFDRIAPQIQLNVRFEGRERGANADVDNSGSALVYLSPGLSWSLGKKLEAYGFVSLPLYQHVNGLQVEQRFSLSLGVHYAF